MHRLVAISLACLAVAATGCGSDESEGSGGEQQKPAELSSQDRAAVDEAAQAIKSECGAGKKTPAATEGAATLVRIYQAKGPDAAVASGRTLDQVLAQAQDQLPKCGAVEEQARVLGARAAKGRFS